MCNIRGLTQGDRLPKCHAVKLFLRFVGSVWVWLWVVGAALVAALAALVLFVPFNPWVDPNRRAMDYVYHLWARSVLWALPKIRVHFHGVERLRDAKEAYVVCANHSSVADIIVLLAAFPHYKFIVKRKLFLVPLLSSQMRFAGYIPYEPGDPGATQTMMDRAARLLKRGVHVLSFPEGGRSADGQVQRFHRGPFLLAQRAGVKVLPVAVSGPSEALRKGSALYNFDVIGHVRFLDPVDPSGDTADLAALVRSRIREVVEQDRRPAPRPLREPAAPRLHAGGDR